MATKNEFYYDPFKLSDEGQQKADSYQQHLANQPGEWQNGENYGTAMGYLDQYRNRGPFSYDFNADALYNQYKDQYIQQGQMAMMDTMGQAAAMTGGYGNSYAQAVGHQAYNQQLSQLNNIMPELYSMAYDRYNQEGQNLLNMYDIYMGLEQNDYTKHQDNVSNWYNQAGLLRDDANTAYDREHSDWQTGNSQAWDEYITGVNQAFTASENEKSRNFTASENDKSVAKSEQNTKYNRLADLISSTGHEPTKDELKAAGMTEAEAQSLKKAYSSSLTAKAPTYTVLDYAEQKKWEKDFTGATTYDAIERIGDRMESAGVDPQVVAEWVFYYAKNKGLLPASIPGNKPTTGGGSGGGVMRVEAR